MRTSLIALGILVLATATFADYQRQIADITDGMGQSRIEAGRSSRTSGRETMQMGDAAA